MNARIQEIFMRFHEAAVDPASLFRKYLEEGRAVVLCGPPYAPEEIVHAMGAVPMGMWGADCELREAKRFFPAFICSIAQSAVELGMRGVFEGAAAVIIPLLCDSLKVMGENWKYAVPSIPYIPMAYPQNRKGEVGRDFTIGGYERVIHDLEAILKTPFLEDKLSESIELYDRRSVLMQNMTSLLAVHPEITPAQRSDMFKSAFFLRVEEMNRYLEELTVLLKEKPASTPAFPVYLTGILADNPEWNRILEDLGMTIVGDDLAAQTRQYTVCSSEIGSPLERLADKFCRRKECSVLYDPYKSRCQRLPEKAADCRAKGVIFVQTKFCDPEEFDYPIALRKCREAGLPAVQVEIDRQMVDYAQVRTALETFRDMLDI